MADQNPPNPATDRRLTGNPAKAGVVVKDGRAFGPDTPLYSLFVRLAYDRKSY